MIEAIASDTPLVALRGGAVSEVVVVGGVVGPICDWTDGPVACRRRAAPNFGVGQVGSDYEQVYQEVARSVTGSHMMMGQLKPVEPQLNRVGRVDQRVTA
jgi:hypothetical protein